jgi:hypothetical protein
VVYSIKTDGAARRKGLIDVWSENILGKTAAHWRWFPAVYTDHLQRIFYRLGLYFEVLDSLVSHRASATSVAIRELKIYINYIDKVLDDVWEETRLADDSNLLTATWRSPAFDKWLVKEYVVGRHDGNSLGDASAEWDASQSGPFLGENPMELGMHSLSLYSDMYSD